VVEITIESMDFRAISNSREELLLEKYVILIYFIFEGKKRK
jgi:hypothetical protein